jgi:hypothetical protein
MSTRIFGADRRRRVAAALLSAAALTAPAVIAAAPAPASAAATAAVAYTISADWGSGFQAEITVTPSVAVTAGWTLSFDAGDQQVLTLAAYAASSQDGRHVTLANRSFNGAIAAGSTLSLVVQFTNPTYSDVPPSGFVFNGQPAAYTPSPYLVVSNPLPTVPEGGTSTITVALSRPPVSNAVFEVLAGSPPSMTAAPDRLTFTPADWNVPQTVTLSSPVDADTTDQSAVFQLEQLTGSPLISTDVIRATQIDNG